MPCRVLTCPFSLRQHYPAARMGPVGWLVGWLVGRSRLIRRMSQCAATLSFGRWRLAWRTPVTEMSASCVLMRARGERRGKREGEEMSGRVSVLAWIESYTAEIGGLGVTRSGQILQQKNQKGEKKLKLTLKKKSCFLHWVAVDLPWVRSVCLVPGGEDRTGE